MGPYPWENPTGAGLASLHLLPAQTHSKRSTTPRPTRGGSRGAEALRQVPAPHRNALLVSPRQLLQPTVPDDLFGLQLLCLFSFTVNFQV